MRIGGELKTAAAAYRSFSRTAGSGQQAFQVETGVTNRASATANAAPAAGLSALLALQEVPDPTLARRKAVRRGKALLDGLDALKADLLVGAAGPERLLDLVSEAGQESGSGVAELDAVMADIDLRARVELAKLGRFTAA